MNGSFRSVNITAVKSLNRNTKWITCNLDIQADPGQFVMAWLPGIGEKPFSIAEMKPFGLLVVDVGPFSHAVHQLQPGDRIWIKGPLGQGYAIQGKSLLMVGGGYGSAPLYALAERAVKQDCQVVVCLGARSVDGVLLSDEFQALGCEIYLSTEDGSHGHPGLVTEIVESLLDDKVFDVLYACGPIRMLSALAVVSKAYKTPYQLSWEALMRCGMGLCGSCEVPQSVDPALPSGWLACFDGPVFKNETP
jgi:dihydroorotate dehydrogenase electron transfer subunit